MLAPSDFLEHPRFLEAARLVIEKQSATPSLLTKMLDVPRPEAEQLVLLLQEAGVVSEPIGPLNSRKVLIGKYDELQRHLDAPAAERLSPHTEEPSPKIPENPIEVLAREDVGTPLPTNTTQLPTLPIITSLTDLRLPPHPSPRFAEALRFIGYHEQISVAALASYLEITSPHATQLLDELIEAYILHYIGTTTHVVLRAENPVFAQALAQVKNAQPPQTAETTPTVPPPPVPSAPKLLTEEHDVDNELYTHLWANHVPAPLPSKNSSNQIALLLTLGLAALVGGLVVLTKQSALPLTLKPNSAATSSSDLARISTSAPSTDSASILPFDTVAAIPPTAVAEESERISTLPLDTAAMTQQEDSLANQVVPSSTLENAAVTDVPLGSDSNEAVVEQHILTTLNSYFSDLNAPPFQADAHFAPQVERFFALHNTTPAAIDANLRAYYFRANQQAVLHVEEGSLAIDPPAHDGIRAVSFIEGARAFVPAIGQFRVTRTRIRARVNAAFQLVAYRTGELLSTATE